MKALVAVKRVIDYNVKARVKADGSGMFTFAKFVENVTKKGTESGTFSWVCTKPKK